jgi:hypothetical protein
MWLTRQLTPAQQRALALLSAGSTKTAAAQFVGVHRNTVGNWLRSAPFRDALTETRREQDLAWRGQTQSLADQAAARLAAALAAQGRPHTKSPLPFKPKLAIVQPAGQPSRNQPCPCGSGKKFKRCCMSTH